MPVGARSTRCRRESNEIPCVCALLTLLPDNLRWLVTVDAMHTQVVTAKLICATLKSHYLMIVKSTKPKYLPYHRAALG
ncbi:transposase family protein, partial [Mycobacterium ulcerans str. Harvey]